ncbi:MAG: P-II family nitrogen regulator [Planctomycetota bacterium]|nr:MAG: P-II family nitrogen regulator [Planctomycetota bacterium]
MKLVVGIVRPERLEAVKEELARAKVFRLTVSDAQGFAPTDGPGAASAAAAYARAAGGAEPVRKVKLEVAVNEPFVEPTVQAILRGANGGEGASNSSGGDGVVFVLPLDEAVRIRTGERGPEAI